MDFTPEQEEAIYKSGSNIIVSAGAGSGKTAVLSERVLKKVLNGTHVNELLILTFTKAAASEMKDRIRNKIKDIPKLKDELNLISSSYITTFDSFALSVVKKYHYLVNVSSDIDISDESLVILEEKRIIDDIFEELYRCHDKEFESLINNYCVKSDKLLRESILKIANVVNDKIDKDDYLNFIINDYFSDEVIDKYIEEYKSFIENKKKIIRFEISNLSYYFESEFVERILDSCSSLLSCDIDELCKYSKVSLPNAPKNSTDEAKNRKASLKKLLDDLVSYGEYGTVSDIRNSIIKNKDFIFMIVKIIKEYIKRIDEYKSKNNIWTFNDIACLSIDILKNNKVAREELKYSFKEIMIDEYQDTNDIQDIFISLIENNNVYMVGDIKQSIYKFRGSNPNIFKDKYDLYSKGENGYKIDLISNFRSRNEVLININNIFRLLMDYNLGGANYKESHEMVYGNKSYDSAKDNIDYNIDIIEYDEESFEEFSPIEKEIFIIANDIKNKYGKIKVFDKKTSMMRNVKYSDFVIILDRGTYFDLYKKIFEYMGIPLTILKDEKLNDSTDILLIKNIIDFIIRINDNDFGVSFKYDFISIARSFLYDYSDAYIFDCFKNNSFKDSELYKDFNNIDINSISASELLELILSKTEFYSKINRIGEYESVNVRINNLYDIFNGLNNMGFTIEDIRDYLDNMKEKDIELKYDAHTKVSDSVKILTIHKSKGLEYPICYYADLDHKFNIKDSNDLFVASNKYGLIVPDIMSDNDTSVIKKLFKNDYLRDEIDEKIRLLYVALTRAREKMIVVLPYKETVKLEKDENGVIDEVRRLNFLKLSDFIYAIKDYYIEYFKSCDLGKLGLTKNYLFKNRVQNKIEESSIKIDVEEISIKNEEIREEHFSKENINLIRKDELKNMEYGASIHKILELIDFKNYDDSIIEDEFIRNKINKFMSSKLLKNVKKSNIYKEYEFIYNKDNINYHGVIDLMLEYDDHIDIVDYKLKDINDENYIKQLQGYKDYIKTISSKKINVYLYSITLGEIKEMVLQ